MHFIAGMCELLLTCGNSVSCPPFVKEKLEREANWLLATLSWIPKDKETVAFAANYRPDELIAEVALKANFRGYPDFLAKGADLLFSWAFDAGRHETGWAIMEDAIYGLCALSLNTDDQEAPTKLKKELGNIFPLRGALRSRSATERHVELGKNYWSITDGIVWEGRLTTL